MGAHASPFERQPDASGVRRMRGPAPYATAWTVAAAVVCATGLVVVALDAPVGQVIAMVAAGLGVGGVAGFLFMAVTERFEARLVTGGAGWTCLALLGGWGLFRLWPWAGGLGFVLLAALSPWSLEGIRRLTATRSPRSPRSPRSSRSSRSSRSARSPRSSRRHHHGFTVDHPAVLGFLEELGRAATAPVFPFHPLPDICPNRTRGHGPELVDASGAPIDDDSPVPDDTGPDDIGPDDPILDDTGPGVRPPDDAGWADDTSVDVFELRAADPDEVLCEAWMASSVALGQTHTMAGRLAVIRSRQFLLDQLEKRDPEAFARWLASRPLAEDDPSAYFPGRGHQAS